jgi:UDP-4-amino-4-deoxy-L-arabinose-oxoglutarate aminotransferase
MSNSDRHQRRIPYCKPSLDDSDVDAVVAVLRSGWLTTGPNVIELEREFARLCGVRHAVALSSCTAALHLGLHAVGIGPGDEVIMPSLTFVAGAECVLHLGATPVFADVDDKTLCITPKTIANVITAKTRAVIPMHYGGYPLDIHGIVEQARRHGFKVLEDAAHAVGTLDSRGSWPGQYSDGAAFSFYATKNITGGEGGMFVTNDAILADRVRILSLHGMDKDAWKRYELGKRCTYDVVEIGYKYNMSDIVGGLLKAQLARLSTLQDKRHRLARIYYEGLQGVRGISPVAGWPAPPAQHSWCLFAVLIEDSLGISRDELVNRLAAEGIGTSIHFPPSHMFSALKSRNLFSLPVTEWVAQRVLSLPLYPAMNEADATYVVRTIRTIVANVKPTSAKMSP